jgi:hypothetical protein
MHAARGSVTLDELSKPRGANKVKEVDRMSSGPISANSNAFPLLAPLAHPHFGQLRRLG